MFKAQRMIEWGECDALGIVFYPTYFKWMDATFHEFTRSLGFDQYSLMNDFGISGTPLVKVGCEFEASGRFYDRITIGCSVNKIGRSSLALHYRIARENVTLAKGSEVRSFVTEASGQVKSEVIPEPIRMALQQHLEIKD